MFNGLFLSAFLFLFVPIGLNAQTDEEQDKYLAAAAEGRLGTFRILDQKLDDKVLRDMALIEAIKHGKNNIAKYVLKNHKIEVLFLNTALNSAVNRGNKELVSLLFEHGAEVNTKVHGETPLTIARNKGYNDIARFLVGKGAVRFAQEARVTTDTPVPSSHWFSLPSISWGYIATTVVPAVALHAGYLLHRHIRVEKMKIMAAFSEQELNARQLIEAEESEAWRDGAPWGQCLVCLEPIFAAVRTLTCGHSFHGACIGQYIATVQRDAAQFETWKEEKIRRRLAQIANVGPVIGNLVVQMALSSLPFDLRQIYQASLASGIWKGLQQACPMCRAPID